MTINLNYGQSFTKIEKVSLLRTYSLIGVRHGDEVLVVGQNTTADHGGGIYVWHQNSMESDDGVNVIQPDSDQINPSGRWHKIVGSGGGSTSDPVVFRQSDFEGGYYEYPVGNVYAEGLDFELNDEEEGTVKIVNRGIMVEAKNIDNDFYDASYARTLSFTTDYRMEKGGEDGNYSVRIYNNFPRDVYPQFSATGAELTTLNSIVGTWAVPEYYNGYSVEPLELHSQFVNDTTAGDGWMFSVSGTPTAPTTQATITGWLRKRTGGVWRMFNVLVKTNGTVEVKNYSMSRANPTTITGTLSNKTFEWGDVLYFVVSTAATGSPDGVAWNVALRHPFQES